MNWVTIIEKIVEFLFGGGLITIITLSERKMKASLDNLNEFVDAIKKTNDEWVKLSKNYQDTSDKRMAVIQKKDERIDKQLTMINDQKELLDKMRYELYMSNTFRCIIMNCEKRVPPFGSANNAKTNENEKYNEKLEKHGNDK